jgi:outer membrane protein OmpA-like peptidoglycan-associated protein
MKTTISRSFPLRVIIAEFLIFVICSGCISAPKTDTGKGAVIGGAGGAALGALIDRRHPWTGAMIGAAGGAIAGGLVGQHMESQKKDLEKMLVPEINAGKVELQIKKDNALLITMTKETAFAPGSSVINEASIPTLRKIADVVKGYGKTAVLVTGHPDAGGSEYERSTLSRQRGESVRSMLIGMGVSPILITAAGDPYNISLDGRTELLIQPMVED